MNCDFCIHDLARHGFGRLVREEAAAASHLQPDWTRGRINARETLSKPRCGCEHDGRWEDTGGFHVCLQVRKQVTPADFRGQVARAQTSVARADNLDFYPLPGPLAYATRPSYAPLREPGVFSLAARPARTILMNRVISSTWFGNP
jgi:hypothetical protein